MQARNYYYYAVCWILRRSDKRLLSYQGDKVLIWREKIKDGHHDPDILPNFLKNWCRLGINKYYAVFWILSISDKRLGSNQGDKVLIWRKKIKDGHHDSNIFPNFLKNWCSLGINTCIHYVEHQMNLKSGFVDIRVIWYGWEVASHRRTKPYKNKKPPPGRGFPW